MLIQTFNADNHIAGFSYEAAGNLISGSSATYGYHALTCTTIRSTTHYTQDLV